MIIIGNFEIIFRTLTEYFVDEAWYVENGEARFDVADPRSTIDLHALTTKISEALKPGGD